MKNRKKKGNASEVPKEIDKSENGASKENEGSKKLKSKKRSKRSEFDMVDDAP
jgi:hypothetical protein